MRSKIDSRTLALAFALFVLLCAGSALAAAGNGEKVRLVGEVTAIDLKGQNFTLSDRNGNTTKIFVNPATEIEIEKGRNFFGDDDIPFKDMRRGDWVKIKAYRTNGELEASDIEVYRN